MNPAIAPPQFALLGADEDSLRLADLLAARGWRCSAACDVPAKYRPWVRRLVPAAGEGETWESLVGALLTNPAVVVAASEGGANRVEPLRRLAQQGVPLVVVHPAGEAIVALELEMIRGDTRKPLVAWNPGQWHPALRELERAVQAGELGRIQQVALERAMAGIGRGALPRQLARDLLLLDELLGEVTQVSAVGTLTGEEGALPPQLIVTLAGEEGIHARWSPSASPDGLSRLEVIGERGRAVLQFPLAEGPWSLQLPGHSEQTFRAPFGQGEGAMVVARLEAALRDAPVSPTWADACRALEVAECALESLERGKTIPLHREPPSEQKTFKGMMAIGGCGLLLAIVIVLVVGAIADGLGLKLNQWPVWGAITAGLLALVMGFLVLQLVAFLFQPKDVELRRRGDSSRGLG